MALVDFFPAVAWVIAELGDQLGDLNRTGDELPCRSVAGVAEACTVPAGTNTVLPADA